MQTKRIFRWVIVLFLLAALPGLTVALAQGQTPPEKQLPVVTEPGESAAPEFNIYESEPNNTMGQADVMSIYDVIGGDMDYDGDEDFFKFYIYEQGTSILIDVDAETIGSVMDPMVLLYDAAGNQVDFDDDSSGTLDSLLYQNLTPGWWYVKVTEYDDSGGDSYWYDLIVSSPLLISAAAANLGTASVAGIPFRAEDILAWSDLNDGQEKWVMLIDGSDVGFTKNVMNLSRGWSAGSSLVVSFTANVTVTDYAGVVQVVKPWDWMVFNLDQAGLDSAISGREVVHGTDSWLGLTTSSEKLDAISLADYWNTPSQVYWEHFSTVGAASIPGPSGNLQFADEDVFRRTVRPTSAVNSADFDGSQLPGMALEDVFAMSYYAPDGVFYLTILGSGRIETHPVTQKDIFRVFYPTGRYYWDGLVWHGPDHGWNYNIDAIDYPGGW